MKKQTFAWTGFMIPVLLGVLALQAALSPVAACAQMHMPTITQWREEGGRRIPLDADGDPITVGAVTGAARSWARDVSGSGQAVYVLLDRDYEILETRTEEEMRPEMENDPTDGAAGAAFSAAQDQKAGTLTMTASLPEGADGKDVVVTLTNGGTVGEYHLYAKNSYESTAIVPVGEYHVLNVRVQGDSAQEYSASYPDAVTVTEDGGAHYYFDFGSKVEMRGDQTMEMDGGGNDSRSGQQPWKMRIATAAALAALAAAGIALINILRQKNL